jgi:hypothetical protein
MFHILSRFIMLFVVLAAPSLAETEDKEIARIAVESLKMLLHSPVC